jgi:uncharacterized protein
MESVIEFTNESGLTLRGILHSPEENTLRPTTRRLVIFPNGGIMGAEGDYRAHVGLARYLETGGYHVIRFSPAGTGYSDGEIAECRQKDLYNHIENGLLVSDIRSAVKFSRRFGPFASTTLAGVCGGAISSLLAASELDSVDSVVPIGAPVVLDSDEQDYGKRGAALDKQFVLKMYAKRLLSPGAWVRLILKKSDMSTIGNSISALFKRKDSYFANNGESGKFSVNPLFFSSMKKILKREKRVLFVFGETDGFWWEFQKLYLEGIKKDGQVLPFDIYLAPKANHMLSLAEMQQNVAKIMLTWLNRLSAPAPGARIDVT